MTDYTVGAGLIAAHDKTLVANTTDTVTFVDDCDRIEVLSDGTAALYFTVDGSTAIVSGAHCYKLPAGSASAAVVNPLNPAGPAVSLISSGTPSYSVTKAS
jgi:hypothetical protein